MSSKAEQRPRRDPQVTSRIMSRVRDRDSRAELALRRALHRQGVRYRLQARDVVGRPDLVIRRLKVAVFVDGDMWHGNEHRRRGLARIEDLFPTNTDWWAAKIRSNIERDQRVTQELESAGWTVVRIWESTIHADPEAAATRVRTAVEEARSRHG